MNLMINPIVVGQELPPLSVGPINRTALALYAGASGDHNPIHIDIDFARKAGLDDVFAHGMLSMAYLGRLLTNCIPQENIRSFNARFVGVTHIGDVLSCTGRIAEIKELNGKKVARVEIIAGNSVGETRVLADALVEIP